MVLSIFIDKEPWVGLVNIPITDNGLPSGSESLFKTFIVTGTSSGVVALSGERVGEAVIQLYTSNSIASSKMLVELFVNLIHFVPATTAYDLAKAAKKLSVALTVKVTGFVQFVLSLLRSTVKVFPVKLASTKNFKEPAEGIRSDKEYITRVPMVLNVLYEIKLLVSLSATSSEASWFTGELTTAVAIEAVMVFEMP